MTTPSAPALRVTGLNVALAGSRVPVVSDVTFEVPRGMVFGLVGESGSGKSTVARALLGYARRGLEIVAGQVAVDGIDLLRLPPAELRSARGRTAAYIAQDPASALNPGLRIGRQLMESLAAHQGSSRTDDPRSWIQQVLREVKLEPSRALLRAYPHQLSGGQQQRVIIAMAFIHRPTVIVLDEPTTGLDVTTQRHVLETVNELCRTHGVATIYVSHDLGVVAHMSQMAAVMYAGRVIESGPSAEIFGTPRHPYTARLLSSLPSYSRATALAGIPGHVPAPGSQPPGCAFEPRCLISVPDCRLAMPDLLPVAGDNHFARCILADQAASAHPRRAEFREQAQARSSPAGALLTVRQVSAFYGPKQVLHDLSLEVSEHECLAIVGESGSGKSTLARCLVGMHTAYTGELTFRGAPLPAGIHRRDNEVARAIQFIFQNPHSSLNPRRTIGQIMSQPVQQFSALPRREQDQAIAAALLDVALEPSAYLGRYPQELSGGEAQRIAIARALLAGPNLLICDEVTSSLDASVQAVVVETLRELQRSRGLAMIFITHNVALVRSIATTVLVMHNGVVVERGAVSDVVGRPAARYTAQLIEDGARYAVDDEPADRPVLPREGQA